MQFSSIWIHFNTNNEFYFEQLSGRLDNCQKTFLFQAIQFNQTILIQTIQFSISIDFVYTQLNVKTILYETIQFSISTLSMSKTVPFQTIQFSISMQFSSIQPKYRVLSGASIPGYSGTGDNGNEEVLCIPQNPSVTVISGHSWGVLRQSVYSTASESMDSYQ